MNPDDQIPEKESIKKKICRLLDYIWDAEITSVSKLRRFGVKFLRVVHLVYRGFREDDCALHSSALTFSTLMAIVPVLALSLSLARGLGDVDVAKEKIREAVIEWTSGFRSMPQGSNAVWVAVNDDLVSVHGSNGVPEIAVAINGMVDKVFLKVENISFKAIGGIGLIVLLFMVIDVLGQVESAFNRVWAVSSNRRLLRKFTDYLSVVIVLPVLIIAASSLPLISFVMNLLDETVGGSLRFWVGSAIVKYITMIIMAAIGFTFLIVFMPNTKVRTWPGLTGGFVTALLFIGWLWLCAALQIGVANYGKIYGSFAVIPIMLAWVYVSWGIVLFGAEVAFAVQNCSTYRMEQGERRANVDSKIILALSVVLEAARSLAGKGGGFDLARFAERRRIPVRIINEIMDELTSAGLMAELSEKSGRYVLLKTPEKVRVKDVVDVVMQSGVEPVKLGLSEIDPGIQRIAKNISDGLGSSLNKISLNDLIGE